MQATQSGSQKLAGLDGVHSDDVRGGWGCDLKHGLTGLTRATSGQVPRPGEPEGPEEPLAPLLTAPRRLRRPPSKRLGPARSCAKSKSAVYSTLCIPRSPAEHTHWAASVDADSASCSRRWWDSGRRPRYLHQPRHIQTNKEAASAWSTWNTVQGYLSVHSRVLSSTLAEKLFERIPELAAFLVAPMFRPEFAKQIIQVHIDIRQSFSSLQST